MIPPHHAAERGFSLLEVGLALTISLLASASIIAIYQQSRNNAGDAAMRNKISALQVVIENLYNTEGAYPPHNDVKSGGTVLLTGLRTVWKLRRPEDYLLSPYGGTLNDYVDGTGIYYNGIGGSDVFMSGSPQARTVGYRKETNLSPGSLYYYRMGDKIGNVFVPNAADNGSIWDQTLKKQVPVFGYGVAGIKTANCHIMVTSGR